MEYKDTSKEKLEAIKKCILNWDEKELKWFDDILKDLEEKEKQSLLLKNIRRNNCESVTPLCNIFQGLTQEERYKYIEHIYYSYKELEEQKELLESELKLEKDKVKYVMKQLEKQDRILELLIRAFGKKVLNDEIDDVYERNIISKNQYDLLKDWVNNKEWLNGKQ